MQNYTYKALINSRWLLAFILFSIVFPACEIEEEDLEDDWVQVIVPRDLLETDRQTVDFVWEALDGADEYQLQIAEPSFLDHEIDRLLVDTITSATKFSYTFSPGKYEWRIRGINSSSMTYYRKRLMKIDSATSLSNQSVILRYPIDNGYVNTVTPTFQWDWQSIATSHRFQLHEGTDFGNNLTKEEVFTNNETSYLVDFNLQEAEYSWGVRGEETFSITPYSTRTFLVDVTDPDKPTLSIPASDASVNGGNIQFNWTVNSGGGSPEFDTIEIYHDSLFTLDSLVTKRQGSSNAYSQDTLEIGDYYWRVKRFDKAGNSGEYSAERKFIVN